MKSLIAKIWVPLLMVTVAAMQSFGIDAGRAMGLRRLSDSLSMIRTDDSSAAASPIDSRLADNITAVMTTDTAASDSVAVILARDTIRVPDSLKDTDPFFYKYYIAVKDSLTRAEVRDSLILAGDTLELMKLDSLYIKDSTEVATAKFNAWYASLSRRERKKYDAEQALPGLIAAANRKMEIKRRQECLRPSHSRTPCITSVS